MVNLKIVAQTVFMTIKFILVQKLILLYKITKKNVSFNNNDEVKTFISEQEQEEYEEELNIFKKLKKFNKNEDNISLQMNDSIDYASNLNEDRITKLEKNVQNLNFKIDKIIDLLNTTIRS